MSKMGTRMQMKKPPLSLVSALCFIPFVSLCLCGYSVRLPTHHGGPCGQTAGPD